MKYVIGLILMALSLNASADGCQNLSTRVDTDELIGREVRISDNKYIIKNVQTGIQLHSSKRFAVCNKAVLTLHDQNNPEQDTIKVTINAHVPFSMPIGLITDYFSLEGVNIDNSGIESSYQMLSRSLELESCLMETSNCRF